jgi:hypothetical protein
MGQWEKQGVFCVRMLRITTEKTNINVKIKERSNE